MQTTLNASATIVPVRSKLDQALQSMQGWPKRDSEIFIASFASNKPAPMIAAQFGLSEDELKENMSEMMRRFMRPIAPASRPL